jgi:hypothetical protein
MKFRIISRLDYKLQEYFYVEESSGSEIWLKNGGNFDKIKDAKKHIEKLINEHKEAILIENKILEHGSKVVEEYEV